MYMCRMLMAILLAKANSFHEDGRGRGEGRTKNDMKNVAEKQKIKRYYRL